MVALSPALTRMSSLLPSYCLRSSEVAGSAFKSSMICLECSLASSETLGLFNAACTLVCSAFLELDVALRAYLVATNDTSGELSAVSHGLGIDSGGLCWYVPFRRLT